MNMHKFTNQILSYLSHDEWNKRIENELDDNSSVLLLRRENQTIFSHLLSPQCPFQLTFPTSPQYCAFRDLKFKSYYGDDWNALIKILDEALSTRMYTVLRVFGNFLLERFNEPDYESSTKKQIKHIIAYGPYIKDCVFSRSNLSELEKYFREEDRLNAMMIQIEPEKKTLQPIISLKEELPNLLSPNNLTGIELLKSVSPFELKPGTTSGLIYKAFIDSIEKYHQQIKTDKLATDFYKRITELFGCQEDVLLTILEKRPFFAHVFLFFLKFVGKRNDELCTDPAKNEYTSIDLSRISETDLADAMIKNVLSNLSIFELIGLNAEGLEILLGKLVDADNKFAEMFCSVFEDNGLPKAVLRSWNNGYAQLLISFFSEAHIKEDKNVRYSINNRLMGNIFESLENHLPAERTSLKCFPWISPETAIKALTDAPVTKNPPKPNVAKAKEMMDSSTLDEQKEVTIKRWLETTSTCGVDGLRKRLKLNVDKVSAMFEEFGASTLNDCEHLVDDPEFGEDVVKGLMNIKMDPQESQILLIPARCILKALIEDTKALSVNKQ